jgi:hypothetical protein
LDRWNTVKVPGKTQFTYLHKGKLLGQARNPAGYMYVSLSGGGKQLRNCKVHHLVLEAFVGPRPPGAVCCHKNDIPNDNRLENLRWDTPRANVEDKMRNGGGIKTHCKRGHEFTPENTRWLVNPSGARRCKECTRIYGRDRYARNPEQKNELGRQYYYRNHEKVKARHAEYRQRLRDRERGE